MTNEQQLTINTEDKMYYYDPECIEGIEGPYTLQIRDLPCNQEQLVQLLEENFEIDLSQCQIKVREYKAKDKIVYTFYVQIEDQEVASNLLMLNGEILNEDDPEEYLPVRKNQKQYQQYQPQFSVQEFKGRGSQMNEINYKQDQQQQAAPVFTRGSGMSDLDRIAEEVEKHTKHSVDEKPVNFANIRGASMNQVQQKYQKQKQNVEDKPMVFTRGSALNNVQEQEPQTSKTSYSSQRNNQRKQQQSKTIDFTGFKRGGAL